jgi:precorrin-2 dehydrogenase/sirohydrochlorin ferrochelatase
LPIALNAEAIHAVIIGGGTVATRKALAIHEAGALVKVIAPEISDAIRAAAAVSSRLQLEHREYLGAEDLADSEIVFAATGSTDINDAIAADARSLHRLVDVVSDGSLGSFVSMATHRDGQVTIGVTAGGAPKEAIRIRDSIARQMSGPGAR